MILLEELHTEFGTIKIMHSADDGTRTYYQEHCFHSQIDAEGNSTCGYVHAMHSIIANAAARDILMIGCAGGTLATMLQHDGCKVTVVDINPHAFALARTYFQMPQEVECVAQDGYAYLAGTKKRFDAIAVDVFGIDGAVPDDFIAEAFFRRVRDVLNPGGVVVMNVMVAHDFDRLADHIGLVMEACHIPALLYDRPGKRHRNVIIAGGRTDHFDIDASRKPACVAQELQSIVRRHAIRHDPA